MRIKIRDRFYMGAEGEGEQSFVKWLQQLADEEKLHIHLDCQLLGGGGYKPMLESMLLHRKRKERSSAKAAILIVDSDRAQRGDDDWSLDQLRYHATEEGINVCVQNPNQEGYFCV